MTRLGDGGVEVGGAGRGVEAVDLDDRVEFGQHGRQPGPAAAPPRVATRRSASSGPAKAATVAFIRSADGAAPGDGIILTRGREKGAIVQPGETVFTLTLSSPVWVRTYVNERDLGWVRPGLAAQVRTDSAPGKIYPCADRLHFPDREFTPKTVETRELRTDLVYRLRIVVDNPDGGLRQGMPVTVTLDLDGGD